MENWKYRKHYIELVAEQRTPGWFNARKCRVTASKYASLLGLSNFESVLESVESVLGITPQKAPNAAMQLGTEKEDVVRKFYCEKYRAQVIEPSLCIGLRWYDVMCPWTGKRLSDKYKSMLSDPDHPNWFLAGSPDGFLTFENGQTANMEIKFPKKMYGPLIQKSSGTYFSTYRYHNHPTTAFKERLDKSDVLATTGVLDYYPHIYTSHLFQMQGCMALTGEIRCAYVVGSLDIGTYDEIVLFDEDLWRHYLYPELIRVIETEIKPRMTVLQKKEFREEICSIISSLPKDCEIILN